MKNTVYFDKKLFSVKFPGNGHDFTQNSKQEAVITTFFSFFGKKHFYAAQNQNYPKNVQYPVKPVYYGNSQGNKNQSKDNCPHDAPVEHPSLICRRNAVT